MLALNNPAPFSTAHFSTVPEYPLQVSLKSGTVNFADYHL